MTGFNVAFNVTLTRQRKYSSLMMVLGPKHVLSNFSVLMCKLYISALVGIIIE